VGSAGECEECKRERMDLHRSSAGHAGPATVPPIVHDVLRSPGQPLDAETRAFFEPRFGYDFGKVRLHANAKAAKSAQAVNALAYTVGHDIVFNVGQFSPATAAGRQLIAHELTHVVQQGSSPHRGDVVSRAVAGDISSTRDTERPDATARLLALAAEVESIHSQAKGVLASKGSAGGGSEKTEEIASSEGVHPINHEYVHALASLPGRLRAVARAGNEQAKLKVLSAFAPLMLERAKTKLRSDAPEAVAVVQQRRPVGLATSPIQVSSPYDSAEVEADNVAARVASGMAMFVRSSVREGMLSRQAGAAVMGAGEALLSFEAAGGGEVEAGTGPPGWIVGGVILLAAGVLIGTGYLMSRPKTREKAAEKAEPTTAEPPPPPDLCKKAIKILTQYERLAEKFGLKLPASRIQELNRLRDSEQITINHLPGSLRGEFPLGTFGDMTLAAIRGLCKM
jgi:hypothetical protein